MRTKHGHNTGHEEQESCYVLCQLRCHASEAENLSLGNHDYKNISILIPNIASFLNFASTRSTMCGYHEVRPVAAESVLNIRLLLLPLILSKYQGSVTVYREGEFEKMAQSVKGLPSKHEDLSSDPQTHMKTRCSGCVCSPLKLTGQSV